MTAFTPTRVLVLDWSAASAPSPARPCADAIWIGTATAAGITATYHRTRADAARALHAQTRDSLALGETLLIGADFPFGYPAGFAAALTGQPRALHLWDWLSDHIEDHSDNRNNRFALANAVNARCAGTGPFWGRPAGLALPHLPDKGLARHGHPFPERRAVEALVPAAQPCWKLYTTGSVGSQALLGIPVLNRLRAAFPGQIAVWPFEPAQAPVLLAEVYPSLLAPMVRALTGPKPASRFDAPIKDAVQVRLLAASLLHMARTGSLGAALAPPATQNILTDEGWILGAGAESSLRTSAATIGAAALPPQPGPRRIR